MRYFRDVGIFLLLVTLWILLLTILISLLPVIVLMFVLKNTEAFIYYIVYDAEAFASEDILWTMCEEKNQPVINGCIRVEGILSADRLKTIVEERLIRAENGKTLYPRATRRMHSGFMNYYWVEIDDFSINDQVYELYEKVITSEKELQSILSKLCSKSLLLQGDKSPWEFVLIPCREHEVNKTVILFRLAHAIADGSALAYFLLNCLADINFPLEQDIKKFSERDRILMTLKGLWTLPLLYAKLLFKSSDENILHTNKLTGNKIVAWSKPFDLAEIKTTKNRLHATVNDIMFGCLAITFNKYFTKRDVKEFNQFSTIIPVDMRTSHHEASYFSNQIAALVMSLPIEENELKMAVMKTKERIDRIKTSGAPFGIQNGWRFLSFILPQTLSKYVIFGVVNKTTAITSNLIGPKHLIKIDGHSVDLITFWPPQTSNQTIGISFCSYNGHIRVGIETDSALAKTCGGEILDIFEKNLRIEANTQRLISES